MGREPVLTRAARRASWGRMKGSSVPGEVQLPRQPGLLADFQFVVRERELNVYPADAAVFECVCCRRLSCTVMELQPPP